MAAKPNLLPDDEELIPTSITDKLVELPDESVIDVDVSDNPDLATAEDDKTPPGATEPPKKTPVQQPVDDGSSETLAALQKRIEDNDKAARERIQRAEQTAEQERQARLRSEQAAREREQVSQEETAQREMALITQGIESATGQLESLEEELARLNEAGEFAKAAKVQTKISRTAAQLDRLESEKASFEANIGQRRTPTHEGAVTRQETATPQAAFDQYLSGFVPAAANWIRNHPECAPPQVGGSSQSHAKMMAGHYDALAQNVELNSPDYFRIIEEHTGHRQKAAPEGGDRNNNNNANNNNQQRQPTQRKPLPSAPPTREVPGSNTPGRTRQVRLSKEQQEAALLSFPHMKPQEALAAYARNLVELEAEGKMNRTSH
jgi:hypothetical protein